MAVAIFVSFQPIWATSVTDTASTGHLDIELVDGLLSIDSKEVPLERVLSRIGELAGFRVEIEGSLDAPVTRSFANRNVLDALLTLMNGIDHVIILAESPRRSDGVREIQELRVYASASRTVDAPSRERTAAELPTEVLRDLASPHRTTRLHALRVLAGYENGASAALVRAYHRERDPTVRAYAVDALGQVGDTQVLPVLIDAAYADRADVRMAAVRALGKMGGGRALEILGELLTGDADRQLRLAVVHALSEHSSDTARALLVSASEDEDDIVRSAAQRMLATSR